MLNPYYTPPAFELVPAVDARTLDPLPRSLYATSTPLVCRIHGVGLTLRQLERRAAYGMHMPRQARMVLAVNDWRAA